MSEEELFDYLRSHGMYEEIIVSIAVIAEYTEDVLLQFNELLYYSEEDDEFYWFNEWEDDNKNYKIIGLVTIREVEVPNLNI